MAEMKEVSDVVIDNIRFTLMAVAMAVAGVGGMVEGMTTTSTGLMIGLVIHYWATKFHPDSAEIRVKESWL